ncbi:MAG: 2-amino-4-hydroxy-6-hydroxymethyldihydropteridine diphosphokinase [Thiothrix sp.]|nr:MAG: 2-amino-4-hydroxy-6-hydroxymethyldihydropteridine diphosphokinase [Thiothrix sp.]
MPTIFVSIGSNLEPRKHIAMALDVLRDQFGDLQLSPVYVTEAVGFNGRAFLNLVISLESDDSPYEVKKIFKKIEADLGRIKRESNFSPRRIDLDIILYGDSIIHQPGLELPSKEIDKYAFVLQPLADLAPKMLYPGRDLSFSSLWKQALKNGDMGEGRKIDWNVAGYSTGTKYQY